VNNNRIDAGNTSHLTWAPYPEIRTIPSGIRRSLYRTSDIAPIVVTTAALLVLVLVAAIVVLAPIAALLLAALVLGFIAVTANAAAAVAASALVTAAAPAALDIATGLEVQVDAPGAAGVVVEGVARGPQPFLHAAVLVP